MFEQARQRRVGPVQIVDRQHDRALLRSELEHTRHRAVNQRASCRSLDLVDVGWVPEDVPEHIDHSLDLGLVDDRQQLRRPKTGDLANVFDVERRVEVEIAAQRVRDREPHVGFAVWDAGTFQHSCIDRVVQVVDQLVGKARFPDAVLARDRQQHTSVGDADEIERGAADGEFGLSTDQRAAASSSRTTAWRSGGLDREPDLDGLLAASRVEFASGFEVDRLRRERVGGVSYEDAAWRGRTLQTRCGVDDVAHRGVLGACQRADQDLAGVDADAHADPRAAGQPRCADEVSQRCLHAQRGAHGAFGVVLVRDRRAEQREDAVAEDLVDPAAERRDVVDEQLEARVDQPLDGLRIAMFSQCCEPDQIGEQHGGDPPLLGLRRRDRVTTCRAEPGICRNLRRAGRTEHDPLSVGQIDAAARLGLPRSRGQIGCQVDLLHKTGDARHAQC